jgi:hypothetical protein
MGLVTATLVENCKINAESYISGNVSLDFDAAKVEKVSVSPGATVQVVPDIAFAAAKLKFLYLLSDQDITLTFTLGTGNKTIALLAGIPWKWHSIYAASIPCPFAYDSVSCTVANAGDTAANLTIRGGITA